MQRNSNFNYAGELSIEIEEMEKLIQNEEQIENLYTNTQRCGTVLTIICC